MKVPNNVIKRRLSYLIEEAKLSDLEYDMSIIYTMRLISNFATIERGSGTSEQVKKLNKIMSVEARRLFERSDFEAFHAGTINEHQFPLKSLWLKLISSASEITIECAWKMFTDYPMVTVTKNENAKLNKIKEFSSPQHRYELAGIRIHK